MSEYLTGPETLTVKRAERWVRLWKVLRWVQLAVGAFCLVYWVWKGIIQHDQSLVLGMFHPNFLAILAGVMVGDSVGNRRFREASLLLKLVRTNEGRKEPNG
ncbi:MAG: hypothetical protein R3F22_08130 [Lysobacteraceae bacterium]